MQRRRLNVLPRGMCSDSTGTGIALGAPQHRLGACEVLVRGGSTTSPRFAKVVAVARLRCSKLNNGTLTRMVGTIADDPPQLPPSREREREGGEEGERPREGKTHQACVWSSAERQGDVSRR